MFFGSRNTGANTPTRSYKNSKINMIILLYVCAVRAFSLFYMALEIVLLFSSALKTSYKELKITYSCKLHTDTWHSI
jgi:hypothetical protein